MAVPKQVDMSCLVSIFNCLVILSLAFTTAHYNALPFSADLPPPSPSDHLKSDGIGGSETHKEIDLNSNYYHDNSNNNHNQNSNSNSNDSNNKGNKDNQERGKSNADCLTHADRLDECRDEFGDSRLPAMVITCLNNCANCVKQWRSGVYNGRTCALDCIEQVDNLESLDPDCSLVKYFNSTILASII